MVMKRCADCGRQDAHWLYKRSNGTEYWLCDEDRAGRKKRAIEVRAKEILTHKLSTLVIRTYDEPFTCMKCGEQASEGRPYAGSTFAEEYICRADLEMTARYEARAEAKREDSAAFVAGFESDPANR